ncbi:hypothetical protein B0H13DRAFT_1884440 [Mycena leptocephala]|nr:hypothetical protein B0H13DRAFT_1884440 [Mycena leptocephala]
MLGCLYAPGPTPTPPTGCHRSMCQLFFTLRCRIGERYVHPGINGPQPPQPNDLRAVLYRVDVVVSRIYHEHLHPRRQDISDIAEPNLVVHCKKISAHSQSSLENAPFHPMLDACQHNCVQNTQSPMTAPAWYISPSGFLYPEYHLLLSDTVISQAKGQEQRLVQSLSAPDTRSQSQLHDLLKQSDASADEAIIRSALGCKFGWKRRFEVLGSTDMALSPVLSSLGIHSRLLEYFQNSRILGVFPGMGKVGNKKGVSEANRLSMPDI